MGQNQRINADDLYPEATHGRMLDPDAPKKEHHEPGIIVTREEEGSEEIEREKKIWHDHFWLKLDDRLSSFIIFGTVIAGFLYFLNSFFSRVGFKIIGYICYVLVALIVLALLFLTVRSIKNVIRDSKKKKDAPLPDNDKSKE